MPVGTKSRLWPGFLAAAVLAAAWIEPRVAVASASEPSPLAPQPFQLNSLFQDHAVLQRDVPIAVWGQAAAGEGVTVSLHLTGPVTTVAQTQANSEGRWKLVLPAMGAGGPYELTAKGSSGSRTVHDLLIGDVFLCSGQSNMEFPVQRADDSEGDLKRATNNTIRLLNVEHATSVTPLLTFGSPVSWKVAASDTVSDWSAVCYFFARELQPSVHVPMGLVQSTWSGSNIRPWMSVSALHANGGYEPGLGILALYANEPLEAQHRFAGVWEQWWRASTADRPGAEPWSAESPPGQWRTAPAQLGDWRGWDVAELKTFTGQVWYRTQFTLTPAQAASARQRAATVTLGAVNQVEIGRAHV